MSQRDGLGSTSHAPKLRVALKGAIESEEAVRGIEEN